MTDTTILGILDRIYDCREVTDADIKAGRIRALVTAGFVSANGHRIERYGCVLTHEGEAKRLELRAFARWREANPSGWRPTGETT